MERMARSATPFIWERKSVQRVDKISPALSECSVPTSRLGSRSPRFKSAANDSEELAHVERSFSFGPHGIRRFEPRMIVHEHKQVLEASKTCSDKGSGNVGVNQPISVGGFVELVRMGQLWRIGFGASMTTIEAAGCERCKRVGSELRELAEAGRANVESAVQTYGGITRRHHVDVVLRSRSVYRHGSGGSRRGIGIS
eukprot:2201-Pleurochrysis_carterae.AAC.2